MKLDKGYIIRILRETGSSKDFSQQLSDIEKKTTAFSPTQTQTWEFISICPRSKNNSPNTPDLKRRTKYTGKEGVVLRAWWAITTHKFGGALESRRRRGERSDGRRRWLATGHRAQSEGGGRRQRVVRDVGGRCLDSDQQISSHRTPRTSFVYIICFCLRCANSRRTRHSKEMVKGSRIEWFTGKIQSTLIIRNLHYWK